MEPEGKYNDLSELIRYGFTFNDIYDLVKLRAYESIQRYRDYGLKPGYV